MIATCGAVGVGLRRADRAGAAVFVLASSQAAMEAFTPSQAWSPSPSEMIVMTPWTSLSGSVKTPWVVSRYVFQAVTKPSSALRSVAPLT